MDDMRSNGDEPAIAYIVTARLTSTSLRWMSSCVMASRKLVMITDDASPNAAPAPVRASTSEGSN